MAEAINCNSCGAANQLPEGKNSMFCAFCGAAIQAAPIIKDDKVINESSIKTKPQITQKKTKVTQKYIAKFDYDSFTEKMIDKGYFEDIEEVTDNGGELSLINRGIKSFEEISSWFSDNELTEIKKLILYNNKIENFQGLERFTRLQKLDLTNNQIADLPKENSSVKFPNELNLTGNPIADNITIEQLNYYPNIQIDLGVGASKVKEANELRVKLAKEKKETTCRVCGKEFTEKLGDSRRCSKCENAINEDLKKTNLAAQEKDNQSKNPFLNFSTLNWVHLLAPLLLAFIFFALVKKMELPISFFGCLGGSSFFVIIISFYRFMDRREKTGRSFDSQIGRIDEYKTVHGNANVTSYYWYITLFHIIVIILSLKLEGNYSSTTKNNSNTPIIENSSKTDEYNSDSYKSTSEKGEEVNQNEGITDENNLNDALVSTTNDSSPSTLYESVVIGNQNWMVKNLDIVTFRNGDQIPEARNENEWKEYVNKKQPAWCFISFDSKNKKYDRIYNMYAVFDDRGLAPVGWKIPTNEDWNELSIFLGKNENPSIKKLKEKISFDHPEKIILADALEQNGFKLIYSGSIECVQGQSCRFDGDGTWWSGDVPSKYYIKGSEILHQLSDGRVLRNADGGYPSYISDIGIGESDGAYIRCIVE